MPLVKEKWENDLRTIGKTIVGCIEKTHDGFWFAYGCMNDWQDVELGCHNTEIAAKRAVNKWVAENKQ